MPMMVEPGEAPDQDDGRAGGDRDGEERQDRDAEGGLADGREQDVAEEAEQHVRRVAGRVGGAHDRQDGLELARVPERRRPGMSPDQAFSDRRSARRR